MSSAVFPKRREIPGKRALPIIVYFEDDAVAAKYFIGVQRFRRLLFSELPENTAEGERIILLSKEDLVERHYNQLRVPNTRVLALTNFRFRDPRNDGAVYAYLPSDIPESLLERMADNALDHIHLVHSRHEVNQKLAGASQEIHELNQIGMALSAEHDPGKLLELILTKSREFTSSDAGSSIWWRTLEEHAAVAFVRAGRARGRTCRNRNHKSGCALSWRRTIRSRCRFVK